MWGGFLTWRGHGRPTAAAIGAITLLVGCTPYRTARSNSASQPAAAKPPGAARTLGAAGCHPASPIHTNPAFFPEVQGTGAGATLFGLIMPSKPLPIRIGEDVKVVWRMTGSGSLQLSLIDPYGKQEPLQWGPEAHGGSSYDRPGDEWGAGYRFPRAGCWQLRAQRTHGSGDVWLQVHS